MTVRIRRSRAIGPIQRFILRIVLRSPEFHELVGHMIRTEIAHREQQLAKELGAAGFAKAFSWGRLPAPLDSDAFEP